jgi:hypothetical protein
LKKLHPSFPEPLEARIAPATFTVSSTADSGPNTFRQAILDANATPGADVIAFGFAAGTFPVIAPLSPLPTILGDVSIKGELTLGAPPEVVLDGISAGAGANGLNINGDNVSIVGLVICNFTANGIRVLGSNNTFLNNYIGTDVTGTADVGNGADGILIAGGSGNVIGISGAGNLIAGNAGAGVHLGFGSTGATAKGNRIGVDVSGTVAIPNLNGVLIDGDSAVNNVGGAAAGEGNLISGNVDYGIRVNSTASGSTSAPSQFIKGNLIGTASGGTGDLGNGKSGIYLLSSQAVRVGGTASGEGNIISGNNQYGVEINSGSRHQLQGNWIGIDATGNAALGNSLSGIRVDGSNLNVIGAQTSTARNVISGNGQHGIHLVAGGDSTTIIGNLIGTNAAGNADLGNTNDGVRLQFAKETTIGGGGTNAGNVISGNGGDGVFVQGSSTTFVVSLKQNNIGTDLAGNAAIGNSGNGIQFSNVTGSATIGSAGSGNIIAANTLSGILIGTADATVIQGNIIGKSGLANARGILINASTGGGVTVGGIAAGQGNNTGFNTGAGIAVAGTANASIRGNNIHDSGGIGIDLGNNGATANDGNDSDSGANGLLNFPVLSSAVTSGGSTVISGTYTGLASTVLTIDFYSNSATGQAETYLGSKEVTTDALGVASFSHSVTAIAAGRTVSATSNVTSSPAQTSEISPRIAQSAGSTPAVSINDVTVSEGNSGVTNFVFTLSLSSPAAGSVTVDYATANDTAIAGLDYTASSGTVTFLPGEMTRQITIPVLGETTVEATEKFFINLSNPSGATLGDAQGIGTIANDDAATLSVSDGSIVEGNSGSANLTFTVSLSAASATAVTLDYSTANGTAIAGLDYTAASGTVTFAAGELTKTFIVPILGDVEVEGDEAFFVNLSNPSGATILDGQAIGTIRDNDSPTLAINDVTIFEANSGVTNMVFTVSMSVAPVMPVTVDYATANFTAIAGLDYTASSGSLSFAAGEMTKTISVEVYGDSSIELSESFFVNLSNASGATIGDSQGLGTITNDDFASISIADVQFTESDAGTSTRTVRVTLSEANPFAVSFNYATQADTAVAGNDYVSASGTVTIPSGETTADISLSIAGDIVAELTERFFVNISSPVNATIADSQGVFTILDNDSVSISVSDVSITEGNAGETSAVFTVSLSNSAAFPVSVAFATVDDSANAGMDYTAKTGTLNFAAGETTKTVTIQISGDLTVEAAEAFILNLNNAENATIADSKGVATIANDDVPAVSIASVSAQEGNSGVTEFEFLVSLSQPAPFVVSVDFSTTGITAISGTDFTAMSGTLTIPAGTTTGIVVVPVAGDGLVESVETFRVTLSNAMSATISGGEATGTIQNDDSTTIGISGTSLDEGNSGNSNAVFTVSLSAPSALDVVFDFSTRDDTARAGSDYAASSGTRVIPAGSTSIQISVPVAGDTLLSEDEAFFVDLANVSGAIAGQVTASAIIRNDDSDVTATISGSSVGEGNSGERPLTFGIILSGGLESDVSIDFSTVEGTAVAGTDFVASNGAVTFAAGELFKEITVSISGDTTLEASETFTVKLGNTTGAPDGFSIPEPIATGGIVNDDFAVNIAGGSAPEGTAAAGAFTFTVTLSSPAEIAVTVDFTTRDGTAIGGDDYAALSGTITFEPGETSVTKTVVFANDAFQEATETLFVDLSNASVQIATATATISILDDDAPLIRIEAGNPMLNMEDGADDAGRIPFRIVLSKAPTIPLTVRLITVDGSAGPDDFFAINAVVTFAIGQTEFESEVVIVSDRLAEPDETFSLQLSDPLNGLLENTSAAFVIRDNDGLTINRNKKSATWRDLDGDLVTLKVTKPVLTPELFQFRFGSEIADTGLSGQLLERLDLSAAGLGAEKTSVTISAKRKDSLGDRKVNVGAIDAEGLRLGAVTIAGDLGKILAGVEPTGVIPSKTGVAKLSIQSLGAFGTSTQGTGGDLRSLVHGKVGAITVTGDVIGATLEVKNGKTGALRIGGSVASAAFNFEEAASVKAVGGWTATNLVVTKIASIVIGGPVAGTTTAGDEFEFRAQEIRSFRIAGEKLPLTREPDVLVIDGTSDVFVRETGLILP